MRLVIGAIGRARAAPEQALCDLYLERARAMGRKLGISGVDLVIVETSRAQSAEARMKEEAARLLSRIPQGAHVMILDEAGPAIASEAFARRIAALRDCGLREFVFLIGGPDGLASSLREGAKEHLAFGPQTWPHLLVRAMLAEQIYRAFTILSGHPYHRGRG